MSDLGPKLAIRIRDLRDQLGLTQQQVAHAIGVKRPTLVQIENGKRGVTIDELVALARLFRISCEELLDPSRQPKVSLAGSNDDSAPSLHKDTMRIDVPQENEQKFREILLYILNHVGSRPNIGETVIYKLLYFIDFDYYEKYEEQLVGARYIKNHYGPTPVEFKKIVERMIEHGEIERVKSAHFQYPQTKYLPRREPRLALLSAQELDVINDVLNRLAHMNATQISDYSHGDIPWATAEEGNVIDYESVFYRTVQYSVRSYGDDDGEA